MIQDRGLTNLLGTSVIRTVLDFKWEKYAKRHFLRSFFTYICFLICFLASTIVPSGDIEKGYFSGNTKIPLMALSILNILFVLYYLRLEFSQAWKGGLIAYVSEVWNYIDIAGYVMLLSVCFSRFLSMNSQDALDQRMKEDIVESLAAIFLWLKTLSYLRAFRSTGPFVRMIIKITARINNFMIVLIIVLLGFSHGYYILFRSVEGSDFSSPWVLLSMYTLMLGDWDFEEYEGGGGAIYAMAILFFVTFTFFVAVVMLNLV